MHRARPRVLGQRHRQHLDQDARDIVLRLLFGQSERIDLHAIAEQPPFGIIDAVTLGGDLVPQLAKRPHLAEFGDEAQAGIDEKGDASHRVREGIGFNRRRGFDAIEHGDRGGERKGDLLHRRRARLLQVV